MPSWAFPWTWYWPPRASPSLSRGTPACEPCACARFTLHGYLESFYLGAPYITWKKLHDIVRFKVLPLTAGPTDPHGCQVCPWEQDCKPPGGVCWASEERPYFFPRCGDSFIFPPAGPEGSEYVIQWPALKRNQVEV